MGEASMNSKVRIVVGISGCVLSLVAALFFDFLATFGLSGAPAGTVDDHIQLLSASPFIGIAAFCIFAGIFGMKPARAAAVAVAVCVISLPAMQLIEFGSITVSKSMRVDACNDNYRDDDRLTRLAETENIYIRIEELIDAQCTKHRDALSASGKLPHPISAAQVKQFARSIPTTEKCENKYVDPKNDDPNTIVRGIGLGISAYCAELSDAGKLRNNGTIIGTYDAQRVSELTKKAVKAYEENQRAARAPLPRRPPLPPPP